MPNLGSNIPEMGIPGRTSRPKPSSSMADALFSNTQQRVLGLIFGQPDRSFYATEIISLAGGGSGAVQRELARLEQSGLVTVHRIGTQKHFQANPTSPLYAELCGIAMKTVGLAEPLREALAPFADKIVAAFVYGSVAKRSDTATSDIDLMVVSDTVSYPDVYTALEPVSSKVGRTINPTVYSRQQLARRIKQGVSFATKVLKQPKIWLIGSEDVLSA